VPERFVGAAARLRKRHAPTETRKIPLMTPDAIRSFTRGQCSSHTDKNLHRDTWRHADLQGRAREPIRLVVLHRKQRTAVEVGEGQRDGPRARQEQGVELGQSFREGCGLDAGLFDHRRRDPPDLLWRGVGGRAQVER